MMAFDKIENEQHIFVLYTTKHDVYSLYTGPLILRNGAISHIWPQIAFECLIYRSPQN
jgi:hypothetical protein